MAHHTRISWKRKPAEKFTDLRYSRVHTWSFDGGVEIPASSSPSVVPLPYSDESAVDPEEAFTAALSSCHMLSFLAIAAKRNLIVEGYEDQAEYIMAKNADAVLVVESVILRPAVKFGGSPLPTPEQLAEMHALAHHECFLANSVKSRINIIPREPTKDPNHERISE